MSSVLVNDVFYPIKGTGPLGAWAGKPMVTREDIARTANAVEMVQARLGKIARAWTLEDLELCRDMEEACGDEEAVIGFDAIIAAIKERNA